MINRNSIEAVVVLHQQMLEQCKAYQQILKDNTQAISVVIALEEKIQKAKNELELLFEEDGKTEIGTLTKRETEVLTLVAKGFPNKEIAYHLSISDRTVQFHLKSVFDKLLVSSRTEAVIEALKRSLISP